MTAAYNWNFPPAYFQELETRRVVRRAHHTMCPCKKCTHWAESQCVANGCKCCTFEIGPEIGEKEEDS